MGLGPDDNIPGVAFAMFAHLGVAGSMALSCMGAAYGTAKAGAGLASMGVLHPNAVMRNMIPVVMAGVLGIYGLIISVILAQNIKSFDSYSAYDGFAALASGLSCGLSSVGMFVCLVEDVTQLCKSINPQQSAQKNTYFCLKF